MRTVITRSPRTLRTAVVAIAALLLSTTTAARAAEPFGTTPCPGVQPGAWIEAPRGTIYTMGFVLKGVDAKKRVANYVTTVGAFVYRSFGTKVWPTGGGPTAYNSAGRAIGKFVYAVHIDTPDATSFGLVKLDKAIKANPQVCHFGGPTDIYDGIGSAPVTVQYYGQGVPADSVSPARTGIAVRGTPDAESVFVQGLVSFLGDEGGPVVVDGAALGYFDGAVGGGRSGAGFAVARLGPWLAKAQKALKTRFTLRTAKTL
jgi:hypothetical protein